MIVTVVLIARTSGSAICPVASDLDPTRMKLELKWDMKLALAAVVLVLVGLAAAPWTVSQDAQIVAIGSQISAGSGLRLTSHGRSVFAVLPRPHIRIYDARLEQEGGALQLAVSSLRVDLGLIGLATGRLDPARVVLADAQLTIDTRAPLPGPSDKPESRGPSRRAVLQRLETPRLAAGQGRSR